MNSSFSVSSLQGRKYHVEQNGVNPDRSLLRKLSEIHLLLMTHFYLTEFATVLQHFVGDL